MRLRLVIAGSLAVAFAALPAATARATFPGENGKIAFSGRMADDNSNEIYTVNADGTDLTRLTDAPGNDIDPSWSPDGTKITFSSERDANLDECGLFCGDIYSMNADGTDQTRLTTTPDAGDTDPAWSPDGAEIAFASRTSCCASVISLMNADGTNQHTLITNPCCGAIAPTWSPSGDRISFEGNGQAYVANADGSGIRFLGNGQEPNWSPYHDWVLVHQGSGLSAHSSDEERGPLGIVSGLNTPRSPVWSPDMERVAVAEVSAILLMRPDGSNASGLIVTDGFVRGIDWLAIPATIPGYARPAGATPMRVPLVPAYEECTDPDRQHAPPLAFPSCSGPKQSSARVTVGTPDANGAPSRSVGHVSIRTIPGNPTTHEDEADVLLTLHITDVRRKNDLTDYTGALVVPLDIRMTDRYNGCCPVGGPHAATSIDNWLADALGFGAACAATADPEVGATCSNTTTMEAVVPGSVPEGVRTTWELQRIQVFVSGEAEPFAVQGIFVP